MSKLRDFQVVTSFLDRPKPRNQALFATTEPVRLWLKAQRFDAPFIKLLVTLQDVAVGRGTHGRVMLVEGICEVTEEVDTTELDRDVLDHRWVLGIVKHALSCVAEKLDWRSEPLEGHLDALAASPLPLEYVFDQLAAHDKASGTTCVPWYRSRPGSFEIGVRITRSGEPREVVVRQSSEPLYLEDDFPMAALKIRNSQLIIVDKRKAPLATIAL